MKNEQRQYFKKARLVDCDGDLSARWYVVFYAWHEAEKKLVRKRDYSINNFTDEKGRRAEAKKLIAKINKMLESGYVFKEKAQKEKAISRLSEGLQFVLAQKNVSRHTVHTYRMLINRVKEFDDCRLDDFSLEYAQKITDWRAKSGIGKTSLSNFVTAARVLFQDLHRRGLVAQNYFLEIHKPAPDVKRNLAFSESEAKNLLNYFKQKSPGLWLLAITMLYTFIRVTELRELRAGWVLWDRKQILIPAEFAKSRKSRYVGMSKYLIEILREHGIDKLANDAYVYFLDKNGHRLEEKYFSMLHLKFLKLLNMDGRGHTLYSWKHTGVVMAYKSGLDIKTIQRQCGHSSVQTTDVYLRSLGLFFDENELDILPKF